MTMHFRTTATAGDGLDFVISDGSRDRHGTRINPDGWDLTPFRGNPIALFGHNSDFPIGRWENVRTKDGKLVGTLRLAAKGTSQRIDELISLVEQGILRAVSVGFSILKEGKPGSTYEYEQTELHEASLVSVGSNKNALAMARALHISESTIQMAFGEQAEEGRRGVSTPGEHADNLPVIPQRKTQMDKPLSQRITDAQEDLNEKRDALNVAINDDAADDVIATRTTEVDAAQNRLTVLQNAERAQGANAAVKRAGDPAPLARPALGKKQKTRSAKPGDLVIRAGVVNALAYIKQRDPIQVLEERYGDHEETQIFVRAAVDPAKTTVSGWAQEVIETDIVGLLESLRPISVFARLREMGLSLDFGPGAGAIKIPSRTASPSISGSFVGEGSPIPVRRIGLTSTTLTPHKMGVISYWTREIQNYSTIQFENMLREEIQADTALTLDTLLLDAVAGSAIRPAGLTYNLASLTPSSAGGWEAIVEDILTATAPFDTANAGRKLALIMNSGTARRLGMTPGPDGTGFGWADRFLSEFTILKSTTVPAGDIYVVDAADFATAGGLPEFDVSEQTVLHAEDTSPAQISAAGSPNVVAAPVVSMFQTASIALRMLMPVTWAMRRAGMVQWIDNVDWSAS